MVPLRGTRAHPRRFQASTPFRLGAPMYRISADTLRQHVQQGCHTVSGTLLGATALHPLSGLVALQLRGGDTGEIEVLADAASTHQQLASAFGSTDAAMGKDIEVSLDVFGFPDLRTPNPVGNAYPGGDA